LTKVVPTHSLSPSETAEQEREAASEGYIHRALVGFDQFVNVLTGGYPDETISSRSARAAESGQLWGIAMSWFLDLFQSNHGAKAQAGDVERAREVENLEESSGALGTSANLRERM
jgi:hypothetical protein